ncbi:MFS transporter [Priestia megaterium]|uniref:MFS transporter n=1 Tax=Priestia megaterium TaxID=1404 RepID=UPI002795FE43|nr:MFS transporter [Priestia megaterium]
MTRAKNVRTMEEIPLSKIHIQMFLYNGGGAFIDGYILGIIAVALAILQPQFDMSLTMVGLIGTATLAGMFLGGTLFGYITDKIGRKKMFILDLIVFIIASVLQLFVTDPIQLLILRFILGVAVGADYPIASSLMAEFSPRKNRGTLLGGLVALWYVGYGISYLVGYLMLPLGDSNWRWMLASSAVPALIVLLARVNMPESPRWLASKGKLDEANDIIKKLFGENVVLSDEPENNVKTSYKDIFRNGYGKWTIFIALFWTLQVAPSFAIATYIPQVLGKFGLADGSSEYLGSAVISIFYVCGLIPAIYLVEKVGRRPVLVWPFLISALVLFVLGATSGAHLSFAFTITLFIIYGIFHNGMEILQWIYPNELFPTSIRATATGFGAGFSRVGASISTFIFPIVLDKYGLESTLYMCAALFFIGFLISLWMAPETKNMSLAETSALNKRSNKLSSKPKSGTKII